MGVFNLCDWSWETTTTNGTGAYALLGAVGPFRPFSAQMSDGDTTYLSVFDGTNYEEGLYTYNASPNTFTRTAIYRSSNGNAAVNWTGGTTKQIMGAQLGITLQSLLTPGSTGVPERTADNTWSYLALSGLGSTLALTQSPALTGAPTAPTQAAGDNSTKIATTAYAASTFLQTNTQKFSTAQTYTGTISSTSGALPTTSNGAHVTQLDTSFTPANAASKIRITLHLQGILGTTDQVTFVVFNGSTFVNLFTTLISAGSGVTWSGTFQCNDFVAGSTSTMNLSVYVGTNSGNPFYFNQANSGAGAILWNGMTNSMVVDEIAPHP